MDLKVTTIEKQIKILNESKFSYVYQTKIRTGARETSSSSHFSKNILLRRDRRESLAVTFPSQILLASAGEPVEAEAGVTCQPSVLFLRSVFSVIGKLQLKTGHI